MKKALILVLLAASSYTLHAQDFFCENRNLVKKEEEKSIVEPVLHGDIFFKKGEHFSFGTYFEMEKKKDEKLSGELIPMVEYEFSEHFKMGTGLGYQMSEGARAAVSLQWKNTKNNFFMFNEFFGNGYWYHAYYNHLFARWLGLGAGSQEGVGVGPRMDIKLPHHFSIWGIYCYDPGTAKTAGLIGLRFHYERDEESQVREEDK